MEGDWQSVRRRMHRTMRPNPVCFLCTLLFSFVLVYAQDKPTKGISAVYAEGKVRGNEYTNDYFGLTLLAGSGKFTAGGFVSTEGKRARLVDVEANPDNWQGKFEIAVLADSLTANPLVHSSEQYVRAVRHQFEKQGMETEQAESPTEVAGLTRHTRKDKQQRVPHTHLARKARGHRYTAPVLSAM